MKQISLFLFLPLITLAQSAPPERTLAPKDFRYHATVDIPQPGGYVLLPLTRGFYEFTEARFSDLRIFDPSGRETAWTLNDRHGVATPAPSRPVILDRVRTAGGALRFVADFGRSAATHNRLTIETARTNFHSSVRVESSDDLQSWDFVRDAVILRLDQDERRLESMAIEYPDSTRRYLRLTIANWPDPAQLAGIASNPLPVAAKLWLPLGDVIPKVTPLPKERATQLDFGFSYRWLDIARITLATTSREFSRSIELQSSEDGRHWIALQSFVIYRAGAAEQLSARIGWLDARRLRLVINNYDDAPVAITRVALEVPERRLVLAPREPGEYHLYLGRADTPQPQYDLDDVLSRAGNLAFMPVRSTEWKPNPRYEPNSGPPKPFSERYPYVLPVVLGLVVAGMGYQAWRLMRKAS